MSLKFQCRYTAFTVIFTIGSHTNVGRIIDVDFDTVHETQPQQLILLFSAFVFLFRLPLRLVFYRKPLIFHGEQMVAIYTPYLQSRALQSLSCLSRLEFVQLFRSFVL